MNLTITNWKAVLETAKLDNSVGIRIAQLTHHKLFSMYVTEIGPKQKINAHYHQDGVEVYTILEGAGVLHVAQLTGDKEVIDKQSKVVMAGDFFNIEPGCAHQLENTGESPLILIFGCPPQHLSDDRIVVEDLI